VPRELLAFAIAERAFAIQAVPKCRWCRAPRMEEYAWRESDPSTTSRTLADCATILIVARILQ
jgi:hypothetical protein